MSEPCPNATKRTVKVNDRVSKSVYKCDVVCNICKGVAMVDDCADCDGAGLRRGGVRCDTCQCYGKVPAKALVS